MALALLIRGLVERLDPDSVAGLSEATDAEMDDMRQMAEEETQAGVQ